jgi:AcrR family transcriptional regulator
MGVRRNPVGISLGAITRYFPVKLVEAILEQTGRQSVRRRRLPAPLMMYYMVALGLFFSDGCREVLRRVSRRASQPWPEEYDEVSTESAISQARTRLANAIREQACRATL